MSPITTDVAGLSDVALADLATGGDAVAVAEQTRRREVRQRGGAPLFATPPRRLDQLTEEELAARVAAEAPGATHEQKRRSEMRAKHDEIRERQRPFLEAQEAARKAEEDRRATEHEAAEEQKRAETEAMLKRRFLAVGGTEAEWQTEQGAVLAEHRRRAVMEAQTPDDAARALNSSRYADGW
jgi:hypothetical protein